MRPLEYTEIGPSTPSSGGAVFGRSAVVCETSEAPFLPSVMPAKNKRDYQPQQQRGNRDQRRSPMNDEPFGRAICFRTTAVEDDVESTKAESDENQGESDRRYHPEELLAR
jgi:hypothetical protein